MNQTRPIVPNALAKMLSLLPAYPGSLLFARALNLTLARHLPPDVRALLEGKTLRIRVVDLQLSFDFFWRTDGFKACRVADQVGSEIDNKVGNNAASEVASNVAGGIDLTIGATAHDFLLLAQRKEDPDTLFFSRRLQMEGDTDLGLLVKNTLDAIEIPVFDPDQIIALLKSGPGFFKRQSQS